MLIVEAINITGDGQLARKDGTSDYEVWIGVNHRRIWEGVIDNHIRAKGAAALLRLIADQMEPPITP